MPQEPERMKDINYCTQVLYMVLVFFLVRKQDLDILQLDEHFQDVNA